MSNICTLQNLTRRLVSVRCNSGRSRHLPPLASVELDEVEVARNAFVEKLVKRHIVSLTRAANEVAEPSSAGNVESKSVKRSGPDLSKLELGQPPAEEPQDKAGDAAEASGEATGTAQRQRRSKSKKT